ncbi:zuotin [Coprinopsis cinerea AmutBmut pab1-1]|nr:zuotin [Coprinopsis cinerea AmutBmut pab1-1]
MAKNNLVNIVEVGPRDGLQNEKGQVIPVGVKVELIDRLVDAGLSTVEAGSFVSPKWVPQMGGTPDVLKQIRSRRPNVHYPVLVPNQRGLDDLLSLLDSHPALTDEIAVFTSATDAFNKANLNCTVAESLQKLQSVVSTAEKGLRVRGYVSVVVVCPYSGKVDYRKVREVAKELVDMGCYEVSLGDTVGQARPHEVAEMLEEVKLSVPVHQLAGHFHDTYGTAVANVLKALEHGVRTIDASVGGLGGCPYSPGATGNVATEDVLYALQDSPYTVNGADDTPSLPVQVKAGLAPFRPLPSLTSPFSRAGRAMVLNKQTYVFDPRPNYPLVVTANRYWDPETSAVDGVTVVFAHGTGFNKESWEPTIEDVQKALEGNQTVRVREYWSIDAPNHGDSAALNQETLKVGYTPIFGWEEYARSIHLFLSGYGKGVDVDFSKRRLVGVGHSMGAVSLVLMTGHYPHVKFEKVILCEVMCMNPKFVGRAGNFLTQGAEKRRDVWPSREEAYNILKDRGTWKTWDDRVLRSFVDTALRPVDEGKQEVTLKCSRVQEAACYRDPLGSSRAYGLLGEYVKRVPTHLIYGGIDDYLPAEVKTDILKVVGDSVQSFTRVPKAGHLLPQQHPAGLAQEIFSALALAPKLGAKL